MTSRRFEKTLTANDTGESATHQAGIHIPKSEEELLQFLPFLDPGVKNPDIWIEFVDETGAEWTFRYVYYNNRLHDEGGTRNEYRLTHTTQFFRAVGAASGDVLCLARCSETNRYLVEVRKAFDYKGVAEPTSPIRLRGWRRAH